MKSSVPSSTQHHLQGGPSNRRQPTRSVRTSANRPSNYYAKPLSYRNPTAASAADNIVATSAAPRFFPAISFFTDAVTALPKELQKHFTMLKETEGKLHQPDIAVTDLLASINRLPDAPRYSALEHTQAYMALSLANSVSGSAAASVANGMTPKRPQHSLSLDTQTHDPNLEQREDLFVQLIQRLKEMTSVLDEKNMILSAASENLSRQLVRFDSAMPHIENEVSEDARLGSNTHWALPHMKEVRHSNGIGVSEKGRRDVTNVNNLAAAAAAVHEGEIAATRSEARREAMLAKRNRARDPDSDVEERAVGRKQITGKARKGQQEQPSDSKAAAGSQQPQKRRRIEKAPAAERAMGAALSGRLGASRPSPRGSPAPDGARKKLKPPAGQSGSRKK